MNINFEIKLDPKLLKEVDFDFRGNKMKFLTYPDVFAYEKIDDGSELLLSKIEITENATVADLGCGNGILGICASTLTKNKVKLFDIDPRAIALAKQNIEKLNIGNAEAIGSDVFSACESEKFDVVLCNIPSHLTKEGEERLMKSIAEHLNEGGVVWMVFQRRIKELIKRQAKEMFKEYKVVAMNQKYAVIRMK